MPEKGPYFTLLVSEQPRRTGHIVLNPGGDYYFDI